MNIMSIVSQIATKEENMTIGEYVEMSYQHKRGKILFGTFDRRAGQYRDTLLDIDISLKV